MLSGKKNALSFAKKLETKIDNLPIFPYKCRQPYFLNNYVFRLLRSKLLAMTVIGKHHLSSLQTPPLVIASEARQSIIKTFNH
jgi:hypothetical protein